MCTHHNHIRSSAVIGLLIRILASPRLVAGGEALVDQLIRKILQWKEDESINRDESIKILFDMAGDRSGSYFLEAVFECCPLTLFIELVDLGVCNDSEKIGIFILDNLVYRRLILLPTGQYSRDNSANFVMQAILRRLTTELEYSSSPSIPKLTETILKSLGSERILVEIIDKKLGLALWLIELTSSMAKSYENRRIVCEEFRESFLQAWLKKYASAETSNGILAELKRLFATLFSLSTSPDSNQVLQAKIVGALVKSEKVSPSGGRVARAVSSLPAKILQKIATSNQLSRAILDIIIDECSDNILVALDTVCIDLELHLHSYSYTLL